MRTLPTYAATCYGCSAEPGDNHGSNCRIYAEVVTSRSDRTVRRADLEQAGCGCPRILVDNLGPQHGGHRDACRRATWITATTRPDSITSAPVIPGNLLDELPPGSWTACWADPRMSRHLIHQPAWATAFACQPGFDTWDAAAAFLDTLPDGGAIPLGVFLALPAVLPAGVPQ
jgi:hypothetical protein